MCFFSCIVLNFNYSMPLEASEFLKFATSSYVSIGMNFLSD